eukprot:g5456.t1
MWRIAVVAFAFLASIPGCLSVTQYFSSPLFSPTVLFGNSRKLVQNRETEDQFMFKLSCSYSGPFPYTASLRGPTGKHRCGAVLIRPNVVLTAASCVDDSRNNNRYNDSGIRQVFLGGFLRDDPIQKRKPVLTIIHESYTGDPKDGFDIAMIKLNKPTCLKPVPFIGRQTSPGEVYTLLGFGRTGPKLPFSTALLGANVTNYNIRQCNEIFGANPPLDDRKVCTKNSSCNCASSCEGDEGGPIILRETTLKFEDTLIAIASYSNGDCTVPGSFSVHTDIQPYENWIMRQLHSRAFMKY